MSLRLFFSEKKYNYHSKMVFEIKSPLLPSLKNTSYSLEIDSVLIIILAHDYFNKINKVQI